MLTAEVEGFMDASTAGVVGLCVLVLAVIGFFAVFRGKGRFTIRGPLGEATAEGENPPPPSAVAAGVKVKHARAGGAVVAHSTSGGGVEVEGVTADAGIEATHAPGDPVPKA